MTCFSASFVCLIVGLQRATVHLQMVGTASFLNGSPVTVKFCLKLSSVKSFAQTHECLEAVKHFLFISISHSLLRPGFWVQTFWIFSGFPLKFNRNLKPKQPLFLNSPTVLLTLYILFPSIFRQFSRSLYDYDYSDFSIPISQKSFVQYV